jgi:glutamate-1-semialdehyde aminotransferase
MAAVRVARTFTGRKKIIKVGGAYHGWSDSLVYALHIPGTGSFESHGIPDGALENTIESPPNDLEAMEKIFKEADRDGGIAAVILEPLGPECATHPVERDFNKGVRALCDKYGALLIFDEVVTAFRAGMGGAQDFFKVMPDLTVLGKIIAGGFPSAGGVGGRKEIMDSMAAGVSGGQLKRAYVGGTLSANPLSCAGGYYCLKEIDCNDAAVKAGKAGDYLTDGINALIEKHKLPFVAYNHASICHLETTGLMHLNPQMSGFEKQFEARRKAMGMMGLALEAEGVIVLAGSRLYTSMADSIDVISDTLTAIDRVFGKMVPIEST